MAKIKKIIIKNYKKFSDFTIIANDRINVLIGDNESGKSTILEIIDIVTNANVRKIENIGICNIINYDAVLNFLNGERKIDQLPIVEVDLFLDGNFDWYMNGKNNLLNIAEDGIRLVIEPNLDYSEEIISTLSEGFKHFPFEYYKIRFSTFADEGYSGYNKKIQTAMIDSSKMNEHYATQEYIKNMYNYYIDPNKNEKTKHQSMFNKMHEQFDETILKDLNSRILTESECSFGLKKENIDFENNLMIYENGISICNKGSGKQISIKTEFALRKVGTNVDVLLIEEPENHLSYNNLRSLIKKIFNKYLVEENNGQIFIATHSSYISMRLELKNALMLNKCKTSKEPLKLRNLSDDTSKFFVKTPPVGILDFILSERSILVEGPSEYMLFNKFYETTTNRQMESDKVQVFDVRGLSFKRYLEIAKELKNKVAIVTDNDHDYKKNIVDRYMDFQGFENIEVFSSTDDSIYTFEVALDKDNHEHCKTLFGSNPLDYMLKNKTEAAYKLTVDEKSITVPEYIKKAIEWINA